MLGTMRLFFALLIAYILYSVKGFTPISQRRHCAPTLLSATNTDDCDDHSRSFLNCGLLISSWTDGVVESPEAQQFLKKGLALSLLSEQQQTAESSVESSVIVSPCCGPDTAALSQLESVDQTLESIQNDNTSTAVDDWISQQQQNLLQIKLLYIPTAMYALRADSNNTPGKQRQRARADGKKRRSQVVEVIQHLFDNKVNVLAITLDFDDGSVKQPRGSDNPNDFPKDGRSALREWSPNLIYIEGGNTFWLHHCMTKGNWQDDLQEAITNSKAFYCGKSAGAILVGRTVETATWKGWDDPSVVEGMETYDDWKGVNGLDLVGGASFFPHMSDEWKDLVDEKQLELGDVCCLRDEDVCLVTGRQVSIISADNVLVNQ